MSDLIRRQDSLAEIHRYFAEEIDKTQHALENGDDVYTDMATVNSLLECNKELSRRIKALPSAQPVRHGRWIDIDTQIIDETKCSNCGVVEFFEKGWKRFAYCPNCGAKMEEG